MRIQVEVQPDHLARQATVKKPVLAIAELIWNGLDAEATRVDVDITHGGLGSLEQIQIKDNGHGMEHGAAVAAFKNLGGSWKRTKVRTDGARRFLHGKSGRGRFRAFALGNRVRWVTRYEDPEGVLRTYEIQGTRAQLGTFDLEDARPARGTDTGTTVEITELDKDYRSLDPKSAVPELTEQFALYLQQYDDVRVFYCGKRIDPAAIISAQTTIELGTIDIGDGRTFRAQLTIVEWSIDVERALVLCDEKGFPLTRMPPGIHAPGFNFTAYLKCEYLRELDEAEALALEELHPDLRKVLEPAKDAMRDHFRHRAAENARDVIEEWKREDVYPYSGDAKSVVERAEREVFEVVAVSVHDYLPEFAEGDSRSRRLAFRLMKEALENSPTSLKRIIQEVLDLPDEKRDDLVELLEKTSLTNVINASKEVTERLEFVRGLEMLLFDTLTKDALTERQQLHKILEGRTWVFGEEYALSVSDKSLTEVLRKHLAGRSDLEIDAPVLRPDDARAGRVDLMLSRAIPGPRAEEPDYLILELKRPNHRFDQRDAQQVVDYAEAVAHDERFRAVKARWTFWGLANELAPTVRSMANQKHRAPGVYHESSELDLKVVMKTWGEVLTGCNARLRFYKDRLNYVADDLAAMSTLKRLHGKYLPPIVRNAGKADDSK